MTIFQKMLFAPILGLLLFTLTTVYSYLEQQESGQQIENFSNDYLPIMEIGNQNIVLFEQINQQTKDAIVASELTWLNQSKELSRQLITNLHTLSKYERIIKLEDIRSIRQTFLEYYGSASSVAEQAIAQNSILELDSAQLAKLELTQQNAKQALYEFNEQLKSRFLLEVQNTNRRVDRLSLSTSVISIVFMLIVLLVTLYFSLTTRRRIGQIIKRMKQLSKGKTDFSHRLQYDRKDEVSYLIYWFNKLSDKLESNYLEIEKASITDKLTQLNNRNRCDTYLSAAIHKAQANSSYLMVVIMDIDHFKQINDTHGHLVGDAVLKQVASILRVEATDSDFIGRWGGEEFVILVVNQAPSGVKAKIEKLRKAIQAQYFEDVEHITASFGLSVFQPSDTPESLLERADKCLYKAKEAGRNRLVAEFDK